MSISAMRLKRTALDAAVSDLVRWRANWTCEKCGEVDPNAQIVGTSVRMDNSHYYKRKHNSTRYDLDNCFCLCKSCHAYLETRPADHRNWVVSQLGEARHELLIQKHHRPVKLTKADKDAMLKHYREEIERIKEKRFNGEAGYIEAKNFI